MFCSEWEESRPADGITGRPRGTATVKKKRFPLQLHGYFNWNFVAVTKHGGQSQRGQGGVSFSLRFASFREVSAGTEGRNLETRSGERPCVLLPRPLSCFTQDCPPRGCSASSGLSPPISIIKLRECPTDFPTGQFGVWGGIFINQGSLF